MKIKKYAVVDHVKTAKIDQVTSRGEYKTRKEAVAAATEKLSRMAKECKFAGGFSGWMVVCKGTFLHRAIVPID